MKKDLDILRSYGVTQQCQVDGCVMVMSGSIHQCVLQHGGD